MMSWLVINLAQVNAIYAERISRSLGFEWIAVLVLRALDVLLFAVNPKGISKAPHAI